MIETINYKQETIRFVCLFLRLYFKLFPLLLSYNCFLLDKLVVVTWKGCQDSHRTVEKGWKTLSIWLTSSRGPFICAVILTWHSFCKKQIIINIEPCVTFYMSECLPNLKFLLLKNALKYAWSNLFILRVSKLWSSKLEFDEN